MKTNLCGTAFVPPKVVLNLSLELSKYIVSSFVTQEK